jgi:hypothetical protein
MRNSDEELPLFPAALDLEATAPLSATHLMGLTLN